MLDPLVLPMVIPLVAGLICLLLPARWEQLRAYVAIAAAGATSLAAWRVFADGAASQTIDSVWLRTDGLSGFVLLAAAIFALLIALYSSAYMKGKDGQRTFYACLLWSLGLTAGVVLANDLILLLICWGLLAVPLYLLIGLSGPDAADAAKKSFLIVGGSDALLVLGAALLWAQRGSTRMDIGALPVDSIQTGVAFLCFAAAAFAKAGAMPLHTWVPDCGEKAHAPVTALLPASLDKLLGIYLLARAVTELFVLTDAFNTLLMACGALTVIGAVMMALVQHDLKRLLAFHAVSQVGYMVMGIGTGTVVGLAGGLFHMLNHAIYKSCLFLGAGVVEKKTGAVELDRLGGLATRLPVTFAACLVASLSISGIPPFNGFVSKWMIYQGVIESGAQSESMLWVLWLSAAMLGSALTLASFVKVMHSVFLCKPSPQVRAAEVKRAAWPLAAPLAVLALLCVVFGVLAHVIPLPWLIEPAIGEEVEFAGAWWAGQASGLIALAFLLGWITYALAMRNGKLRECPTFIGGERMDETRIPGVPRGPERHVEVTGVDFYLTIEQLPLLKPMYQMARRRMFDLYHAGGKIAAHMSDALSEAHSGFLPAYLTWLVLGLLAIVYLMMFGVP